MSAVVIKRTGVPRSTMVTAAIAGAAIAYVVVVFLPTQRSISNIRRDILAKQEHILQSDRLTLPTQQAEQKLQAVNAFVQRFDSMLPSTQGELLRTFGRISEQAKLAGVVVRRFDPQGTVDLASLRQAKLEISLEGTFPQILDFIKRIEELPNLIWITNVRLAKIEGSSELLTSELTLTIFGDIDDQTE